MSEKTPRRPGDLQLKTTLKSGYWDIKCVYICLQGQGGLSPATSEMNLYSFNSRSTSPVPTPTLNPSRSRFSTYDTLMRRRADVNNSVRLLPDTRSTHVASTPCYVLIFHIFCVQVASVHYSVRSSTLGAPNKKDYIEELTKQLDACQKVGFIWVPCSSPCGFVVQQQIRLHVVFLHWSPSSFRCCLIVSTSYHDVSPGIDCCSTDTQMQWSKACHHCTLEQ